MELSSWRIRNELLRHMNLNWELNTVNAFFLKSLAETSMNKIIENAMKFIKNKKLVFCEEYIVTAKDIWQSIVDDQSKDIDVQRISVGFHCELTRNLSSNPYSSLKILQLRFTEFFNRFLNENNNDDVYMTAFGVQKNVTIKQMSDFDKRCSILNTEHALLQMILSYLDYKDIIEGPLKIEGLVHAIACKAVDEITNRNLRYLYCSIWTEQIQQYLNCLSFEKNVPFQLHWGNDAILLINGFGAHLVHRFMKICKKRKKNYGSLPFYNATLSQMLKGIGIRGDISRAIYNNAADSLNEYNGSMAMQNMRFMEGQSPLEYRFFFAREDESVCWHHEQSDDPESNVHFREYIKPEDSDIETEGDSEMTEEQSDNEMADII